MKAELIYIHETAGDFIFEVHAGEGEDKQMIGFTKVRKLTGIEVSNIVPDLEFTPAWIPYEAETVRESR